jgi:acyl-coenzyme A synthetase/AMP-(fatty) acid ligase
VYSESITWSSCTPCEYKLCIGSEDSREERSDSMHKSVDVWIYAKYCTCGGRSNAGPTSHCTHHIQWAVLLHSALYAPYPVGSTTLHTVRTVSSGQYYTPHCTHRIQWAVLLHSTLYAPYPVGSTTTLHTVRTISSGQCPARVYHFE